MNALTAARAQMEVSLGFHMIFAALGIGMPLLMLLAELAHLRTGQSHYRDLAKKWGKATALLFAVGAVSGTALSFELGLLWPRFMRFAGAVIGPAFALEGYAFFIEAIFVGLYLYGWDRLSPRAHFLCGIPVAISGMLSGVLVVAANAWMQHPVGFTLTNGMPTDIHPGALFTNPYWFTLALHSTLSCYVATSFAVAGVYAVGMLRGKRDWYHRSGVELALLVGSIAAIAQVLSGDLSAQNVAHRQPTKLAAMESHFETSRGVPLIVGGMPDPAHQQIHYAIEIPRGLSLMAFHDPNAEIIGLDRVPQDQQPNVVLCHLAFQLMVACGFGLLGLGALFLFIRWRRKTIDHRLLLIGTALCSPLGMLALEAGWLVTEAGRQPWAIYGIMRTRDAVTPSKDVLFTFLGFTILYLALGTALIILLRFLARSPSQPETAH